MVDHGIHMQLDVPAVEILSGITTATLTTLLLKKGLRNVWLRGARPRRPGKPRLLIPAALHDEMLVSAPEQKRLEGWRAGGLEG